jgi:hypothetical protein
MTHPELFDILSFPVFAADENGRIIYKNRAAMRHIGTMRMGSGVVRHLLGDFVPSSGVIAHIKGDTSFSRALVLADKNKSLFLCLPRLQYPDFEKAAEDALCMFGETPDSFADTLSAYNKTYKRQGTTPSRLASECLRLRPRRAREDMVPYSMETIVAELFTKAEKAFGALGYRIRAEILSDFMTKRPVSIALNDFLFLFSNLLYLVMKLSDDGKLDITLSSDAVSEAHVLRFYTHSTKLSQGTYPACHLFSDTAPECAADIVFMEYQKLFSADTVFSVDGTGALTLEYPIPYLDSALTVRSVDFNPEYTELLTDITARICDMLAESNFPN